MQTTPEPNLDPDVPEENKPAPQKDAPPEPTPDEIPIPPVFPTAMLDRKSALPVEAIELSCPL